MLRILLVAIALASALAACGSVSCPPDHPCSLPDGGNFFACGKSSCHAGQICLVPESCTNSRDFSAENATCQDLPPSCADAGEPCGCQAGVLGQPFGCCWDEAGASTTPACDFQCQ